TNIEMCCRLTARHSAPDRFQDLLADIYREGHVGTSAPCAMPPQHRRSRPVPCFGTIRNHRPIVITDEPARRDLASDTSAIDLSSTQQRALRHESPSINSVGAKFGCRKDRFPPEAGIDRSPNRTSRWVDSCPPKVGREGEDSARRRRLRAARVAMGVKYGLSIGAQTEPRIGAQKGPPVW